MKLKKLPGFSLGLIALAVGNAYADQFIQHEEHKHAVAIKDGEVKDIDNALVITTGNGSYGVSVAGEGSNLTINNGVIVTTGGLYPSDNSPLSKVYTASAVVSEYGGAVTLRGNNTIVKTGDYSVGFLSQVDGNLNTDTIIRVNSDGSVTPLFLTEIILLLLLRVITQSAFLRVHLPEARVRVYLLLMKKVLPIQEVMKITP
ncbi:hypothetical protein O5466_21030 [Escherichia coli]|nr:hypothetical protein [Escherichia coli]